MIFNGNQNFFQSNALFNNQNIIFNNQMNNNMNIIEEIEDVYPYIIEEKKNIIFIRYDNSIKKIKIPNSLRKNELYYTASLYKLQKYSDILLSYNTLTLKEDESSINDIPEGSEIYIIEELKDIDSEYYKKYLENHKNEMKINVRFESNKGIEKNLVLALNTTIEEMIKIYLIEMNIPMKYKNDYTFLYNAHSINNENSTISKIKFQENTRIIVIEKNNIRYQEKKRKILKATIKYNETIIDYNIGTLNQIKDLFSYLKNNLKNFNSTKIMQIEGKSYIKEEENTFSSEGIRKDFVCKIIDRNDKKKEFCCVI